MKICGGGNGVGLFGRGFGGGMILQWGMAGYLGGTEKDI